MHKSRITLDKSCFLDLIDCHCQMFFKEICAYGHLKRVERILESIVCVQLVYLVQKLVYPLLTLVSNHDKLHPSEGLVTVKLECVRFQLLYTRGTLIWRKLHCKGIQRVEHASQHDLLVGRNLRSPKLQV